MADCNLAKKRNESGLSQSQLAKAANVSIKTLQAYENLARDINKCQVVMALDIAKALNCKVEDILES